MAFGAAISRTGADALMPEEFVQEVFDGVEQQSIILPRMRKLPNMTRLQERMAILDVLPTASFVGGDDSLAGTTVSAWRNKEIIAQEIRVVVTCPQNVIDDSAYPIWSMIMPRIKEAVSQTVDGAVVIGRSAPALWPSGMKQQAIAAGQSVSLASFNDPYQALAGDGGLYQLLEDHGYMPTAGIGAMPFRGKLRGATDGIGRPLLLGQDTGVSQGISYEVGGVPFGFATNNAFGSADGLAIVGDMQQAVYAFRQDLTYRVSIDGVISDSNGVVTQNLMQQRLVAIILWVRLGWQVPNPPNLFVPGNTVDVNDNNTGRSPFGLLTA